MSEYLIIFHWELCQKYLLLLLDSKDSSRAYEKVASELGVSGGFRRVLSFFPRLKTNSHYLNAK